MKRSILIAIALLLGVGASAQSRDDRQSFDFSRKNGISDKHEFRLTVGVTPLFEDDFYVYDYEQSKNYLRGGFLHPLHKDEAQRNKVSMLLVL